MKKILCAVWLVSAIILASCTTPHPEISISTPIVQRIGMYVGEKARLDIINVKVYDAQYYYSNSRDESKPVFEISNFTGASTTIYALNPGTDTLKVDYNWGTGIFAYGDIGIVVVTVTERPQQP